MLLSSSHIHKLLTEDIPKLISGRGANFEELALELFTFQFQHNQPYQNYASAIGTRPGNIKRWQDIPAVPTRAFKIPAHPLTSFPKAPVAARFLTSGTTTEVRGEHHFPNLELYERAIHEGACLAKLPTNLPIHFLAPSPEEAPHSSLSHMFGTLADEDSTFLLKNDQFSLAPLFQNTQPIFLMGTALAFLHLMESHHTIPLPAGSQLLETGGYKGTSRTLEKTELYRQLSIFFQVPDAHIHNEYGMTELSSQAYAIGSEGAHRFPHWCRAQAICPRTGQELPVGAPGYLKMIDLANAYTIAAIQTQDLAVMHPDGTFHLMGRDPSALPRGCSRSIDDSLSS